MLNQIPRKSTGRLIKPGQRVMWQGTFERSKFSDYDANGFTPELFADFSIDAYGFNSEGSEFGAMLDFARSGTATYHDSAGILRTAPDSTPRRNAYYWNGSAWVNGGLRMESEAATNLIMNSNDFTAWVKLDATAIAAQAVGPDGLMSMARLSENTATAIHAIYYGNMSATSGVVYTASIFLKKGDGATAPDWVQLTFSSSSHGASQYANFNLTTGAKGGVAGGTSFMEDVGGGIYRCSFSAAASSTATMSAPIVVFTDNADTTRTPSYAGVTTADVFIAHGDVVAASAPGSHIPTNGATATRAAETLSIAGAKTPANTTAMSISFKGLVTYADEGLGVSVDGGGGQFNCVLWKQSTSEYFEMLCNTDAPYTGLMGVRVEESSAADFSYAFSNELTPGVNREVNIASRYTTSELNFAKDGVADVVAVTAAVTDLSIYPLQLGITTSNGGAYNGFISELVVWGADIGDTGIAEAST